jgi:hypothetical protein
MLSLMTQDLLTTTVEMVCYFCTVVGVALTFLFARRG